MEFIVSMDFSPFSFIYESDSTIKLNVFYDFKDNTNISIDDKLFDL